MNGPTKVIDPAGLLALSWRVKQSAEFDPSSYASDVEKQSPLQGLLSRPGARTALAGLGVAGAGGLGYLAVKGRREANERNAATPPEQEPDSGVHAEKEQESDSDGSGFRSEKEQESSGGTSAFRPDQSQKEYSGGPGFSSKRERESGNWWTDTPGFQSGREREEEESRTPFFNRNMLSNAPGNALMASGGATALSPLLGGQKSDVIKRIAGEELGNLPFMSDLNSANREKLLSAIEGRFAGAGGQVPGGSTGMLQEEVERIFGTGANPRAATKRLMQTPELFGGVESMQKRLAPGSADMKRLLSVPWGKAIPSGIALAGLGSGINNVLPQGMSGGITGGALSQLSPDLIKLLGGGAKGRLLAGAGGVGLGAIGEDLISDDSAIRNTVSGIGSGIKDHAPQTLGTAAALGGLGAAGGAVGGAAAPRIRRALESLQQHREFMSIPKPDLQGLPESTINAVEHARKQKLRGQRKNIFNGLFAKPNLRRLLQQGKHVKPWGVGGAALGGLTGLGASLLGRE